MFLLVKYIPGVPQNFINNIQNNMCFENYLFVFRYVGKINLIIDQKSITKSLRKQFLKYDMKSLNY